MSSVMMLNWIYFLFDAGEVRWDVGRMIRAKPIPLGDLLSSSLMSLWDGRVFAQQSEIRLSLDLCLGIGLEIGVDNMTF